MMRRKVQAIPNRLEWLVKPGSEQGLLTNSVRSRIEGNARLIGNRGSATYSFRLLSGMDVAIRITAGGRGQVRIRAGNTGLLVRRLPTTIQTLNLTTRVPLSAPIQTLQVIFESTPRGQVRLVEMQVVATDRDEDGDGIPDGLERLLGAPANALRPLVPNRVRTLYQTGSDYTPRLDLMTDGVMMYGVDSQRFANWSSAGYPIVMMDGFRDYLPYADAFPEQVQTRRDGTRLQIETSFYLAPTPERIAQLTERYLRMVAAGVMGVCPEEPEYWADAGYEPAFQALYQQVLGRAWQPPHESHSARWTADRLKARLMNQALFTILNAVRARKPSVKRMVAVHSPLNYALWRICLAHYDLLFSPDSPVEEIIGQVWSDTVRTPIPSEGDLRPEPFAMAFLEYSSLAGLVRGTDRRLWFLSDPLSDVQARPISEHQAYYFATLVASMMFPEATGYEVLPWPERIFGNVPADYATTILSAIRASEAFANQPQATLDAGVEGIGALFSDSMTAVRGEPEIAPVEDLCALTVPLVKAGIPVNMLSLQRAPERGYLVGTRVLIWTPETVKPLREAELRALAEWVQNGGWLWIVGGTNGYDEIPNQPWRQAGQPTPVHWLMQMLGTTLQMETVRPQPAPPDTWREIARHGTTPEPGTLNRRWLEIDLSQYAGQTVYLCFRDSLPDTGWGALVRQVRLEADGRTLTAFPTGSPVEAMFLYTNDGSLLNSAGERYADRNAQWVYRFPLPNAQRIALRVEIAQEWLVELSTQPPYPERVLEPTRTDLPRLVLRGDENITYYSAPNSTPLYLHEGRPVGISLSVGRGGVVLLGASGRLFGRMRGGDDACRAVARLVCGQANLRYRERARILARRGDWVAVYGTTRTLTLRGTYLDVLNPRLPIQTDIPTEPSVPRLLLQVDGRLQRAGMLHTNARIVLQNETSQQLAYYLRGPEGVNGVARLSIRGLRGQATLTDTFGTPQPLNAEREGNTLLVRWNMSPTGHVLMVR